MRIIRCNLFQYSPRCGIEVVRTINEIVHKTKRATAMRQQKIPFGCVKACHRLTTQITDSLTAIHFHKRELPAIEHQRHCKRQIGRASCRERVFADV